jgi:hypothetical protein
VFPLELVESIPGWMLPGDAEKLYELAQETSGPVLEIGTYRGRSAVLMGLAGRAAGRDTVIYSIDVERVALRAGRQAAEAHGVADRIVFVHGTLAAFARAYPQLRPALTFVDGDHSMEGASRDVARLRGIVPSGGLILFHDYNDPLNDDPACTSICVRPAVAASWVQEECDFVGVFGCCGLFVRRTAAADTPAAAELMALEPLGTQFTYRVRRPLAAFVHATVRRLRGRG